ncbi:reticulate body protein Rbp-7 [Chlamydia ibidis]|nr:reticulate body protein Rbp-7 [Chlamydia ibidis]
MSQHTITMLPREANKLERHVSKVMATSKQVFHFSDKLEPKDKQYEVCQAESTLSVEANKIIAVAEGRLFASC